MNSDSNDHHHHCHSNHDENKIDLVPSPDFHSISYAPRALTETELITDDEEVAMLINQQRSCSQRSRSQREGKSTLSYHRVGIVKTILKIIGSELQYKKSTRSCH